MSHVPELPTQYVCEECNSIYAGIVSGGSRGNHTYTPPEECAACGSHEFIEITQYPVHVE